MSATVLVDYVKGPSHGASAASLICIMHIYLATTIDAQNESCIHSVYEHECDIDYCALSQKSTFRCIR